MMYKNMVLVQDAATRCRRTCFGGVGGLRRALGGDRVDGRAGCFLRLLSGCGSRGHGHGLASGFGGQRNKFLEHQFARGADKLVDVGTGKVLCGDRVED